MDHYNFLVSANSLDDPPFEGFSDELCFIPSWRKTNNAGYHYISAKEFSKTKTVAGHRLVMELLLGPFDASVLHRCGNASCLNPYHLYVGDDEKNSRDRALHEAARNSKTNESSALGAGHWVLKPKPVALSQEESHITSKFSGFLPTRCFFAHWLYFTFDGYPQLCESDHPGSIVGAHRKIYQLFNGPLDSCDILMHACRNKHCLNPYHIMKSGKEDVDDWNFMHDKRCKINGFGRRLIANRLVSTKEVARILGLHPQTVYELRRSPR